MTLPRATLLSFWYIFPLDRVFAPSKELSCPISNASPLEVASLMNYAFLLGGQLFPELNGAFPLSYPLATKEPPETFNNVFLWSGAVPDITTPKTTTQTTTRTTTRTTTTKKGILKRRKKILKFYSKYYRKFNIFNMGDDGFYWVIYCTS
jgi:hypothetical protein